MVERSLVLSLILAACGSPVPADDGPDAGIVVPKCDSSFTVSPTVAPNTPVLFQATAKNATYAWSFGGGMPASSTSLQANVTFDVGNHEVALTVSGLGSDGCTTTTTTKPIAITCASGSHTFEFTGGEQDFDVPACITSVNIDAYGAQGGAMSATVLGGKGGRATGTLAVTPGMKLAIFVGGAGITAPVTGSLAGFAGGWNGGGSVHEYTGWGSQSEGASGTGGGASDVRVGGLDLANRVIVAGGGGGAAGGSIICGNNPAGDAGGLVGLTAPNGSQTSCIGGGGGTQTMGGVTNMNSSVPNTPGALGIGGNAYRDGAGTGGGGGGFYGGGAGYYAGGGGGSSFIGTLTNASTVGGVGIGAGRVIISW